jgi:DNA repair exonuclease SbcCD nuclease subunit
MPVLDHDKVNLTFITDIHLADRAPGRRRDQYRETILGKLEYASELTNKVKGACICGGDVFHRKSPSQNSHALVESTIKIFKSFPEECVYGVVGNHDFSQDNIETLPNQPLGVLIASNVYKSITQPVVFSNKDSSVEVVVTGFDYKDTESTLEALKLMKKELRDPFYKGTYKVCVIHQVGRPGADGDFFGEKTIGYNTLSGYGFDLVLWGHDHSYVEPKTIDGTLHLHYGSLSRASLSLDEVDRDIIIPVVSFSTDGMKVIEKQVPTIPLEACFSVSDSGIKKINKSDEMVSFLDYLEEQVSEVESDDPLEILDTICDDQNVKDLVKDYCEL